MGMAGGEPPRCSPLAHKESSLVNPDVTEEEELGLVGIHDAMDEEGVVARCGIRGPWDYGCIADYYRLTVTRDRHRGPPFL